MQLAEASNISGDEMNRRNSAPAAPRHLARLHGPAAVEGFWLLAAPESLTGQDAEMGVRRMRSNTDRALTYIGL